MPVVAAMLSACASGEPPPHGMRSRRFLAMAMDLVGGSSTCEGRGDRWVTPLVAMGLVGGSSSSSTREGGGDGWVTRAATMDRVGSSIRGMEAGGDG